MPHYNWSASLQRNEFNRFCPNLHHLFSKSSLCKIAWKIAVDYFFVVFSSPFFLSISHKNIIIIIIIFIIVVIVDLIRQFSIYYYY